MRAPRARAAWRWIGLVALLVAAAGCRSKDTWPPPPARVHLGEDACAHCRMIISDERFGAQRHQRGGGVDHYDDVGCLLAHTRGQATAVDPAGVFVRSYPGGDWLRGDRAWVARTGVATPMGSGITGHRDAAVARAVAAEAVVAAFSEVLGGDDPVWSLPVRAPVGSR